MSSWLPSQISSEWPNPMRICSSTSDFKPREWLSTVRTCMKAARSLTEKTALTLLPDYLCSIGGFCVLELDFPPVLTLLLSEVPWTSMRGMLSMRTIPSSLIPWLNHRDIAARRQFFSNFSLFCITMQYVCFFFIIESTFDLFSKLQIIVILCLCQSIIHTVKLFFSVPVIENYYSHLSPSIATLGQQFFLLSLLSVYQLCDVCVQSIFVRIPFDFSTAYK